MTVDHLPEGRLEERLPDLKPRYTEAEARSEAERCLYCADAPCIKACPTEIDVPTFIKKIASGNVRGAARTIFEQNILGMSCARVCPVEVLCVGSCVYTAWHREPIPIGRLQRYATESAVIGNDQKVRTRQVAAQPRKVALVGAGPASLACAAELALAGHRAVIYETKSVPGGLNTTGIAPYKLQADEALTEVEWVRQLGVEIEEKRITSENAPELLKGHDAVFLGLGLGNDTHLGLPGEAGPGVYGATAWIEALKLRPAPVGGKLGRVAVIGGGNTALDCARECAQLGAEEVVLLYRRGVDEMNGYLHELEAAQLEGVRVLEHSVVVGILRDDANALKGVRVARAHAGKPIAGTETELAFDLVLMAIGQGTRTRALASAFPGVALDDRDRIVADPKTGVTGNPKVFAGGDCVNGGKEVVNAVAEGRNAARELLRRWA